jgi:MFS superfamily sulfate permease-like transporter
MASVVVFLVALPLCMGIAIASGVPPALGLATGIIGGLIVGFIAGSPLQVSGPAAGLTVLVWQLVESFGLAALGVAVFAAGLIQVAAGALKLGRWFRAVSPALIHGMLAGIGVLIFASQFHVMVDDTPAGSGLANLMTIPQSVMKGLFPMDGSSHHFAAMVGVITIATILLWNRFRPERLKAVPGPLVAVVAGSAIAHLGSMPVAMVEVPASLAGSLNVPSWSTASLLLDMTFLSATVGIAVIASAETLLCASAVDKLSKDSKTNYDKELMAQGIGNALCGLVGALPMTGVIVRSSANVEAGAKTRWSAIMHGGWLLALVALVPFVLDHIPTAALGAILVYTGYRLANPAQLMKFWKVGRGETAVFVITVVMIVSADLLTGVVAGLVVAATKLLYTFSHLEVDVEDNGPAAPIDVSLHGAATFVKLPVLAEALEGLPEERTVHLHVGGVAYIDHACLELLNDWQERYASHGEVIISWDDVEKKHNTVKPAWAALSAEFTRNTPTRLNVPKLKGQEG